MLIICCFIVFYVLNKCLKYNTLGPYWGSVMAQCVANRLLYTLDTSFRFVITFITSLKNKLLYLLYRKNIKCLK